MPYTVNWLVDNQVIQAVVRGKFPIREIRAASEDVSRMMDGQPGPVHLLVDIATMQLVDFDIDLIRSSAVYLNHPALGWWIVYGNTNPMFFYVGRVVAKMTRRKFFFARTYEEALGVLCLQDPRLASLLEQPASSAK